MKPGKRRLDVNLDELDHVLDGARQGAAERSRLRQAQGCATRHGGASDALAEHGEDQRGDGRDSRR